jgi:xylan 1,4-beta-xylosidase
VGGPSTAGCGWVSEFINACIQDNLPVDFVSTHAYGVDGFVDEFGKNYQCMILDEYSVSKEMRETSDQIKRSAMPSLPLYFTEWSSSFSPRDNAHDSYHEAAFVLTRIKNAFHQVDAMSYWTFSDIFEECGPGPSPFHGGFGLCNIKGLKKPAFFAYKYLNMLGDMLLSCDDRRTLCARDDTGVQVLFWDYTMPVQNNMTNQQYFVNDLPSEPAQDVTVHLEGLTPGSYLLELFGVGYRINDVYTLYHELGSPLDLSREQEAYLNNSCNGQPLIREYVKVDETFDFERKMHQNDVYILKLTRF